MAAPAGPLILTDYLEMTGGRNPDISRTGTARLRFNASTGNIEVSQNGGAYGELASLLAGSLSAADLLSAVAAGAIVNSLLGGPKLVTYQETILFSQFTDGGGASGTLALSTTIPAGARYQATLISGLTGFTGDTSAVIIVGDGTDTDRYNTGTPNVFVTAAAGVDMGVPSGTAFHSAAKTPTVTITSAADFTAVVAGAATLTLFYLSP